MSEEPQRWWRFFKATAELLLFYPPRSIRAEKENLIMTPTDLGADQFTFAGDRTNIAYLTQIPGPIKPGEGGKLDYQGPEGNLTFYGKDMTLQSSPLGTLLTITLKVRDDTGGITFTLLIPRVFVNLGRPLDFVTLALKTSSRGFIVGEGPELTYTILPLLAIASKVPLA